MFDTTTIMMLALVYVYLTVCCGVVDAVENGTECTKFEYDEQTLTKLVQIELQLQTNTARLKVIVT